MNKELFELMDIFEKAKEKFLKEEKEIIEININERTLSARLMFHLQTLLLEDELYREKYKSYSVDCEYNRRKENIKIIPKEYRKYEKEDKQIYPDIILHQRKNGKNLIAIEMKKSNSNDRNPKICDKCKLKFLTSSDKYSLGIYFKVDITNNNNHIIEFFVDGKKYKKAKNEE